MSRPVSKNPPKVLHVVESLGKGAVENWLLRMLEHARESGVPVDWTFYCSITTPGVNEQRATDLGARVVRTPVNLSEKLSFLAALRRELRDGYEVLHSHHDLISGFYLLATLGLPLLQRRIVHVHNADESVLTHQWLKQKTYRVLLRRACLVLADRIVGISNHTLDTFLQGRTRRAERDSVLYYGVDPGAFESQADTRVELRESLGIGRNAKVLLFCSRLVEEKNPLFALEVFVEAQKLDPDAHLIFVGEGPLADAIQRRARQLALTDRVHLLGWLDNVAPIMMACDLYLHTRRESELEGFGLSILEAQLGGLRLLVSRSVPDDPLLPSSCCARLGLTEGPNAWAEAATKLLKENPPSKDVALKELSCSPMHMPTALSNLTDLHERTHEA